MTERRCGGIVACGATLVMALCAAPAWADKQIMATPVNQFSPSTVTMDQGEPLRFFNSDFNSHNVTAKTNGSDGKPLFSSSTIGNGRQVPVEGSQFLTTGPYPFYCTIHEFMTGTLTVSSAGTPVPRPPPPPPPPPDTSAPNVTLAITSSKIPTVLRLGKLFVSVRFNEAGALPLKATARSGRAIVTVAKGTASFTRAGRSTIGLALTRAGRSLLAARTSLRVTVAGQARDRANNRRNVSVSKTLRR
jgi:plastocyanin